VFVAARAAIGRIPIDAAAETTAPKIIALDFSDNFLMAQLSSPVPPEDYGG
jgi:hypothetical protein